ncbi:hypothetical protein AB4K20DRAFT_1963720 [Rhizopus microsporus]
MKEMDLEDIAIQYGDLKMIIDFDKATEPKVIETKDAVDSLTVQLEEAFVDEPKQQTKGLSIPNAAKACGIPHSSAYGLVKEYNDSKASVI